MAPARVRGCVGLAVPQTGRPARLADASRRLNGPRNATSRRRITVRLRDKTCPAGRSDISRYGRRAVVATGRETLSRRMWGRRPGRPGGCRSVLPTGRGSSLMDIVFKGRHTDVLERFRKHAVGKLNKLEKLDQKVIRVD